MKQWNMNAVWIWPFLAGAAFAVGPPQGGQSLVAEVGCANITVIDCDDCENEADPNVDHTSTPSGVKIAVAPSGTSS